MIARCAEHAWLHVVEGHVIQKTADIQFGTVMTARIAAPRWRRREGRRGMSNVVEFPPSDRPITESEIDKLHSKNFRDLEGRISDCSIMAAITLELVAPVILGGEPKHEKAMFAIHTISNMLNKLKSDYQAAYHGEIDLDSE